MDKEAICAILEASKGTGVKKIKLGEFQIDFHDLTSKEIYSNTETNDLNSEDMESRNDVFAEEIEESIAPIVEEFTMANLMASDPAAFEEHLRKVNAEE